MGMTRTRRLVADGGSPRFEAAGGAPAQSPKTRAAAAVARSVSTSPTSTSESAAGLKRAA